MIHKWMNVCGVLVEWNWSDKIKALGENLSKYQFIHHQSHMDWPRIRLAWDQTQAFVVTGQRLTTSRGTAKCPVDWSATVKAHVTGAP
jgi:hypothetical protein